ncbi:signal peptide peptidase SppA [Prosthecochloris sp. N3]|uniref:Signal peptide peptidase SppA n=1 Tax=Prosthecochloris ethylica TaxID=2743976 RepID=A0ABR9XQ73_9CHLB|nr:signal peptide peptidase SppA [Prosthecochloris ethylica]MBF0586505.1 signal peptide peptidase SppA [Prosthecochloris ethylica]MBF0636118.1 signal peptide peptidase SppA [Prosthecochloris ethylica]NUK47745.1 signal peptide peptidase SppA [Prosthecochloris ethylica]
MKNKELRKPRLTPMRAGCLVVVLLAAAAVIGIWRMLTAATSLPDRFVLQIGLSGELAETGGVEVSLPFQPLQEKISLQDALFLLARAEDDRRIESVLLDIDALGADPADIRQLIRAVQRTRQAGTPVNAFLRNAGDQDVWLASACDSVTAERGTVLQLDGLKAEILFFARTLENIGISFQAAQWSEWKTGIEPFTREGASPYLRRQLEGMLDRVYEEYVQSVSSLRGIEPGVLEEVINDEAVVSAREAVGFGIVDAVSGYWEYLERLTLSSGAAEAQDVLVSAARYKASVDWPFAAESSDAIAVISVEGPIVRSAGDPVAGMQPGVDEETLRQSLEAALEDEQVRGIVLRIDSGGGDALASANMLQMLDSARVRKPLVASMSGVAASGGYMIALAADSIFADALSLTGSIGVYALKPEISSLGERIGLRREVVTRGEYADAFTLFEPLDEKGMEKFMETTGWIYDDFLAKVSASRNMSLEEVERVAGGRVWMGRDAVERGLVDRLGGLPEAIGAVQDMAGLDPGLRPVLKLYPRRPGIVELLLQGGPSALVASGVANGSVQLVQGTTREMLDLLLLLDSRQGGMFRMAMLPWTIRIE